MEIKKYTKAHIISILFKIHYLTKLKKILAMILLLKS